MEVSGQLHDPAALPQRKQPQHPLFTRLCKPQSRSGRYGEERNILPLLRIEPRLLIRPARSLVDIPTKLSRLKETGREKGKCMEQIGDSPQR
jgi:hypothetical protein